MHTNTHAAEAFVQSRRAQLNWAPKTKRVKWSMEAIFIVTPSSINLINGTIETLCVACSMDLARFASFRHRAGFEWRARFIWAEVRHFKCIDDIVNCRTFNLRMRLGKMLFPSTKGALKMIPSVCILFDSRLYRAQFIFSHCFLYMPSWSHGYDKLQMRCQRDWCMLPWHAMLIISAVSSNRNKTWCLIELKFFIRIKKKSVYILLCLFCVLGRCRVDYCLWLPP